MHINLNVILAASPAELLSEKDADEYAQAWTGYTGNYVNLTGLVETSEEKAIAEGLAMLQKRDPSAIDFELGTLYGSFADNNAYVYILEPDRIHEAAFVSRQTIGNLLEYGQAAIGDAVPNYLEASDQVWILSVSGGCQWA